MGELEILRGFSRAILSPCIAHRLGRKDTFSDAKRVGTWSQDVTCDSPGTLAATYNVIHIYIYYNMSHYVIVVSTCCYSQGLRNFGGLQDGVLDGVHGWVPNQVVLVRHVGQPSVGLRASKLNICRPQHSRESHQRFCRGPALALITMERLEPASLLRWATGT